MTTAMTTSKSGAIQAVAQGGYSREQIDTLKQTVARGASDAQLALFLEVCRARQLDPFTRQVHWTPQGIICGIDGFRAIADRTERYVPGPTQYEMDGASLVAAHVTVRKAVGGTWHDITESAYLVEYAGGSPIWRKMPRVMLAKCAEARALRRAFPADLSGLYAPEEMDQAESDQRSQRASAQTDRIVAPREAPAPVVAKAPPAPVEVIVEPPHDVVTGEVVEAERTAPPFPPELATTIGTAAGLGAISRVAAGAAAAVQAGEVSEGAVPMLFDALLSRATNASEANACAEFVVALKKGKAIQPGLVEQLRSTYLARKAQLQGVA